MTRPRIPEDTRPDYDATPPTEYTVRFEEQEFTITSADTAEYLHEQGASIVGAKTGWKV